MILKIRKLSNNKQTLTCKHQLFIKEIKYTSILGRHKIQTPFESQEIELYV